MCLHCISPRAVPKTVERVHCQILMLAHLQCVKSTNANHHTIKIKETIVVITQSPETQRIEFVYLNFRVNGRRQGYFKA